jgi:hypothetical protein
MLEASEQQPKFCGGWGQNSDLRPADLLLVRKAIREGWDVPQETRDAVVADVERMIRENRWNGRRWCAVARCIIEMERDNQRVQFAALDELGPLTMAEAFEALEALREAQPWGTG